MDTGKLYTTLKPLLFSIAYRMVGSVVEAEDIVQEAFLSLNESPPNHTENLKSYLCTIVTRRSIDRIRLAIKQRKHYIGPWLPEPIVIQENQSSDPVKQYLLKESVTTAYLLLLEQLSPDERAVFVLRQVLQYDYEEIANIVGKSIGNCRQIFRRAKRSIQPIEQSNVINEKSESIVKQFMQALSTENVDQLMNLLSLDATFLMDGGGKVKAALRPIRMAHGIARFFNGILWEVRNRITYHFRIVNGQPGIVALLDDQVYCVISFFILHEQIDSIYCVVNPDKLVNLE
jgi:RNA polymerase sigma-70 factor (ECF subfamily)